MTFFLLYFYSSLLKPVKVDSSSLIIQPVVIKSGSVLETVQADRQHRMATMNTEAPVGIFPVTCKGCCKRHTKTDLLEFLTIFLTDRCAKALRQ